MRMNFPNASCSLNRFALMTVWEIFTIHATFSPNVEVNSSTTSQIIAISISHDSQELSNCQVTSELKIKINLQHFPLELTFYFRFYLFQVKHSFFILDNVPLNNNQNSNRQKSTC